MTYSTTRSRALPLTGATIGVLWVATQLVADLVVVGDPDPVADPAGAQQTLLDHQPAAFTTIFGAAYLAVLVVFFAAALRRSLGQSAMAAASFGGGVLLAVALSTQALGNFSVLAAARHHDTDAMTTLGYAAASAWPLLSVAGAVFLLATGVAALRVNALPRWLARITIGLGVLALLGPAAFVFWLAAPLWFAAVGLTLQTRSDPDPATPEFSRWLAEGHPA
jgi:hypothetical protein